MTDIKLTAEEHRGRRGPTGPTGPGGGGGGSTGPTGPSGPTGPGINLEAQNFVVSQQGGDTDTIVIDAGRGFVARASDNYTVQATMGKNSLGVGILGCDPASFMTTQFTLKLTSAWASGDSIMFTVEDLT